MTNLPVPPPTQVKSACILWEGASPIDGSPIALIATGIGKASKNSKTGAMIQTWIIRTDVPPHIAAKTGEDVSICGDCTHRYRLHSNGKHYRTCYVTVFQAPLSIYRCYQRNGYRQSTARDRQAIRASNLRMGSYGDPALIPYAIWETILPPKKKDRTGYTHLWNSDLVTIDKRFKLILMASADSSNERAMAQSIGWRTFEVIPPNAPAPDKGFLCPSDETQQKKIPCADCGACNGNPRGKGASPYIYAHGVNSKRVGALHVLN